MKAKLAKKRADGRGGWDRKEECSAEFLSHLLREHVEKGDPVDVGNLAMMLHQRGERIAALAPDTAAGREEREAKSVRPQDIETIQVLIDQTVWWAITRNAKAANQREQIVKAAWARLLAALEREGQANV